MNKQQQALEKLLDISETYERRRTARQRKKSGRRLLTPEETARLIAGAPTCFFDYCRLRAPDFYRPGRTYLVELCNELQAFYEDASKEVLIISLPPRHGKSRTATLFCQWVFGVNPSEKIMTGSYNEMLSTTFSKTVRDSISEVKIDPDKTVFADIFPDTKIKQGDATAHYWTVEGEYSSYLATSPTGTATGFGCSLMLIDDIIKRAYEARNENHLESLWSWFTDTMLSRLEQGGKIIIVMTRWSSRDLAGRAIEHYGDAATVVTMKALQDDGTMLCPEILSRKSYDKRVKIMGADIAAANYQQEPIDLQGALYQSFKTYTTLPPFTEIKAYIDTADTGGDYLCAIVYGVYCREAYVLDVLYTKESMEVTEPATARMLLNNRASTAKVESNNGGRGFARAVKLYLYEKLHSNYTVIRWFTQTKNKVARILTASSWVQEHIYFPVNWRDRWPEYYKAMVSYQREGKNAHDDAQDATTGVAENCAGGGSVFVDVDF